jgi:hypothetical protein
MSNLRIIYDNAADRATISASSNTALAVNMRNDYKGQVHRSSATTVTYTLNWSSPGETIGGIVLPATNMSFLGIISVSLTHSGGTATITNANACPNTTLSEWKKAKTLVNGSFVSVALDANIFPYGGLSKTAVWFNENYTGCTQLTITVSDSGGAGYIDCARIVCGEYWSPSINLSREGLVVSSTDSTQVSRSDAGDLLADQGFITDEMSFNLSLLTATDRDRLLKIAKYVGIAKNVAVCGFPDTTNQNNVEQQTYLVYGKFDNANFEYIVSNYYSQNLKVTGW